MKKIFCMLLFVVVAGCVEANSASCGDHSTCPSVDQKKSIFDYSGTVHGIIKSIDDSTCNKAWGFDGDMYQMQVTIFTENGTYVARYVVHTNQKMNLERAIDKDALLLLRDNYDCGAQEITEAWVKE